MLNFGSFCVVTQVVLLLRSVGNTKVIIANEVGGEAILPGEYVSARIINCSSQVMIGEVLRKTSLQSASTEEDVRQMTV